MKEWEKWLDWEKKWEKEGFCSENMEFGELERMWRDEGDEENEKKKKHLVTIREKNEEAGIHLVAKLHVVLASSLNYV